MTNNMLCLQCKKEYTAKRADSRFCSAVCRVRANRSVTDKPLSVTTVTDKVIVTDNLVTDKLNVTPDKNNAPQSPTTYAKEISKCPEAPHASDCLQCQRYKREKKIKDTEECGEKYFECKKWGICISAYHNAMCLT